MGKVEYGPPGTTMLREFVVGDVVVLPNGSTLSVVQDSGTQIAVRIQGHDHDQGHDIDVTGAVGHSPVVFEPLDFAIQLVEEPERLIKIVQRRDKTVTLTEGLSGMLHVGPLTVILEDFDKSARRVHLQLQGPKGSVATVAVDGDQSPGNAEFLDTPGHPEEVIGVSLSVGQGVDYTSESEPMVSVIVDVINFETEQVRLRVRVMNSNPDAAGFIIAWDPEIISAELYAELVSALGDIARASGGAGVERIRGISHGVSVGEGVPA